MEGQERGNRITILLSGPLGTGKSTVKRMAPGYFRPRLGDTAAMDMDEIYTLIDPDWSGPNSHWGQVTCTNCVLLARSFFEHGFAVVMVAGNGFYHKEVVNQFLTALRPVSQLHHFTLDAQLETIVDRVRKRGDLDRHTPDGLAAWLELVRSHTADWTQVIDTSYLTPEEVLELMHQKILEGKGAITRLIE